MVEELSRLALGVEAYDALDDEVFTLRAFSPYEVGDMPAVAQAWLRSKSQNAKKPCRFCTIEAIPHKKKPTGKSTHYLPIRRPRDFPPNDFDESGLPLRSDKDWRRQAKRVDRALTAVRQKKLSMKYGILGTTILAKLPGIHFTYSFPFDLMHILINTFGNYTTFFGGPSFKGFGAGKESYIIVKSIWEGIGRDTKTANATIPAQFGRAVPNIEAERGFFTAEARLVREWTPPPAGTRVAGTCRMSGAHPHPRTKKPAGWFHPRMRVLVRRYLRVPTSTRNFSYEIMY